MLEYSKKFKKENTVHHIDFQYAHFFVMPKAINEYKKELMKIFSLSSSQLKNTKKGIMLDMLGNFDDYPVISRPYSNIVHCVTKRGDKNNPYSVLIHNGPLEKKLNSVLQYGVDVQSIGTNFINIHHHDRYVHCLDTAINTEIIMRNNNFPEDLIKKAIVAGLLHDIATPAFGDLTMKAFPDLKEEKSFAKYMSYHPEIVEYIEKCFDVSISELQSWIEGEGVIGKIIDIADKFAYTARDVSLAVGNSYAILGDEENQYIKKIGETLQKDPNIFDIMMQITIENDQVIFTNSERLKNVLTLRACMHNLIYLNPYLWGREEYFGLILQYLEKKGHISLEELQKGMDKKGIPIDEFKLGRIYNEGIIDTNLHSIENFFDIKICETKEEALQIIKEMKKIIGEKNPVHYLKIPAFKSGIHFLVDDNGIHKSLGDVIKEEEKKYLRDLSQNTSKYLVLWPKEEYRNNYKTHPELYEFLCGKADDEYKKLVV